MFDEIEEKIDENMREKWERNQIFLGARMVVSIVSAFILLFSSLAALLGGWFISSFERVKITAKIESIAVKPDLEHKQKHVAAVTYSVRGEGKRRFANVVVSPSKQVGDTVPMYYDTRDPSRLSHVGPEVSLTYIGYSFLALASISFGIYQLMKRHKRKEAERMEAYAPKIQQPHQAYESSGYSAHPNYTPPDKGNVYNQTAYQVNYQGWGSRPKPIIPKQKPEDSMEKSYQFNRSLTWLAIAGMGVFFVGTGIVCWVLAFSRLWDYGLFLFLTGAFLLILFYRNTVKDRKKLERIQQQEEQEEDQEWKSFFVDPNSIQQDDDEDYVEPFSDFDRWKARQEGKGIDSAEPPKQTEQEEHPEDWFNWDQV